MQSKLEFEQQQALVEAQERLMANGVVTDSVLASLTKEERKRVVKQQKKPATMTLDQFNTEPAVPEQNVPEQNVPEPQVYKHPRHKDRVGANRTSPAKELRTLNSKLIEVKGRSKKLTEILMSGEMREKTEVLVQVDNLEKVRNELSASLSFTSAQLEQERSLVHQLEIEIKKGAGGGGSEEDLCNRLMGILKNRK